MKGKNLGGWLGRYDPIHRGWTPFGIANGLCTTNGFFFPRTGGGYNLYRSLDGVPDPDAELVGTAGPDASTIQTFPWVVHEAGRTYWYRLVPFAGGGIENWVDDKAVTMLRLSLSGRWFGLLPNAPADLQMVPRGSGCFSVQWTYSPAGQEVEPVGFNLYTTWEGVVDYGSVFGFEAYRRGRLHYAYETPSSPDGARVGWAVRACTSNGAEEKNVNQVFGVARSTPPPINPVVQVTVV